MKTITIPWLYEIDRPYIVQAVGKKFESVCNETSVGYAKNIQQEKSHKRYGANICTCDVPVMSSIMPIAYLYFDEVTVDGINIRIDRPYHEALFQINNCVALFKYNLINDELYLNGFRISKRDYTVPIEYIIPCRFS